MTASLVTRTRQIAAMGQAARAERRCKRGHVLASLVSCYVMAGLFSFLAVRPVLTPGDQLGLAFWIMGAIVVLGTGMMIWTVRSVQGGQRAVATAERIRMTAMQHRTRRGRWDSPTTTRPTRRSWSRSASVSAGR